MGRSELVLLPGSFCDLCLTVSVEGWELWLPVACQVMAAEVCPLTGSRGEEVSGRSQPSSWPEAREVVEWFWVEEGS